MECGGIYLDFSISKELEAMKKAVRQFVDKEVEPRADEIEVNDAIPEVIVSKAKEMGLFGLSIPAEYGGVGLGMLEKCLIFEELGRTHNGFTSLLGSHNGIGTMGIVMMANEQQKKRYLPQMATGDAIGAFALTEPNAGSDASNLTTTAVRQGDKWILNGTKHFITNGPIAGVVTVMAVTDKSKGARGISAFIVEKDFPGYKVGTIEKKMGLKGSHTSELVFEDCEVPEENLLGNEGEGYMTALKVLANGRSGLAARVVGSCHKLIEMSVDYAKTRVQFGKPIGDNQAIQFMLADMAMETEAARALMLQTAWQVDQKQKVIKEAAMTKLFASEAYCRVVDKAVQIHGGMGYMSEYPIERFYRDARITRIYEGTSEIQRLIIARQLLS
jgi:acyl-CoA dehydrogenase